MSKTWIQTLGGGAIDLLEPEESLKKISIRVVASSLSNLCRFTGHTSPRTYSVAEHSVRASWQAEQIHIKHALPALMHDAHESAMGDVSSPVKWALEALGGGEALHELDDRLARAFRRRFGVADAAWRSSEKVVKNVDLRMLMTEQRDVLGPQTRPWMIRQRPYREKIDRAELTTGFWADVFVRRFYELGGVDCCES